MYYQQERQLQNWFRKMVDMFPGLSFRYEYSDIRGVYLVSANVNTEDARYEEYCAESMRFEDEMNEEYMDNAPLFTDNEELFRLSQNALFVDEKYISKSFHVIKRKDEFAFISTKEIAFKRDEDWQDCKNDFPIKPVIKRLPCAA